MGICIILSGIISLVLAVAGLIVQNKNSRLCCILSYIFFTLMPIFSIFDILRRLKLNDAAGIYDIYPTMCNIYIILLVIITVIHFVAYKNQKED